MIAKHAERAGVHERGQRVVFDDGSTRIARGVGVLIVTTSAPVHGSSMGAPVDLPRGGRIEMTGPVDAVLHIGARKLVVTPGRVQLLGPITGKSTNPTDTHEAGPAPAPLTGSPAVRGSAGHRRARRWPPRRAPGSHYAALAAARVGQRAR